MRIFIFDPCFGNMTGHWENYCRRFQQELVKRGHEVSVYGQINPIHTIIHGINFVPIFQQSPFVEMRQLSDFDEQAKLFLENFNKIKIENFQNGDLLIFHSIFPQILAAIIEWTQVLLRKKNIKIALFLQFPPAPSKQSVTLLRRFYYRFKQLITNNQSWKSRARAFQPIKNLAWLENLNVQFYRSLAPQIQNSVASNHYFLFTSTEVLAKNFSALLGTHVENLPMPGPIYPQDYSKDYIPRSEKRKDSETSKSDIQKISIGYFGHSSLEKGAQFLEALVAQSRQLHPNVRFILHLNPNKDTENYFNNFAHRADANVECYYGHLTQEKILKLILEVDIVLLPYSIEKYATTPSAIFTESMPLNKVFVLPKNTWLHQEAKRYDAGYTSFSKYNEKNILSALVQAIQNLNHLQQKALLASKKFYSNNNITHYTQLFLQSLGLLKAGRDISQNPKELL